jgi:tetratricopeptide (TPR) repeat protein
VSYRVRRILPCFLFLSWLWSVPALGQSSKAPGTGGGNGPPLTTPPVMSNSTRTLPTIQSSGDSLVIRGGFISGMVQMDDGTPPPQSLTVEKICGSRRTPAAYTDRKGHFSFQVGGGGATAMMPDASESSSNTGFGPTPIVGTRAASQSANDTNLSDCELVAVLPGYRSDNLYLGQRRALDNPDVGVIVLHRLSNVPGTTISATLLNAPKPARKAYDKGMDELRAGKGDAALKNFNKAVELHPTFAAAWYQIGHAQVSSEPAQARLSFDRAIQSDPKYVNPYLDLSLLEIREGRWKDAITVTSKAIQLDPVDFPLVFFYRSIAEFNTDHLDEAEKSAREADHLDAAHRIPKIQQLLAQVLLQKRDYVGAAQYMREYLKRAPDAGDADKSRQQLAEMEKALAAKE